MAEKIGLEAVLGVNDFESGLKKYLGGIARMDKTTTTAVFGLDKSFKAVGSSMTKLGVTMTTVVAAGFVAAASAITAVGVAGTKLAIDIESQLDTVGAILLASVEEQEQLSALVTELAVSPELKVTATEAALALELLARNGLSVGEILEGAAESVVVLANATGADFGLAADIATDAMQIFNIEAGLMTAAVDGITAVTTESKFDIEDYRLALANAGGVAAAVGVEFDDFNTSIAAIAPSFAGGAQAGTGFKVFLQRLVPLGEKATDQMADLGLIIDGQNQFFEAGTGNLKDMAEIADILAGSLKGLSEEQRTAALSTIFGTRAMITATAVARAAANDGFNVLANEMSRVDAAIQVIRRIDNVSGAIEIMGSVIEGVGLEIGKKFLPAIRDLTEAFTVFVSDNKDTFIAFFGEVAAVVESILGKITDFVIPLAEAFLNLSTNSKLVIVFLGAIAAAAGPVLIVVGGLISAIGFLITGFIGISTVLSTVGLPVIAAVVAAIGVLAAAVAGIVTGIGLFTAAFATNFGGLRDAVVGLFQGVIIPIFKEVGEFLRNFAASASASFRDKFLPAIKKVVSFISTKVIPLFAVSLKAAFEIFKLVVRTSSDNFRKYLLPTLRRLSSAIKTVLLPILDLAKTAFSGLRPVVILGANVIAYLWRTFQPGQSMIIGLSLVVDTFATRIKFMGAAITIVAQKIKEWVERKIILINVIIEAGKAIGVFDDSVQLLDLSLIQAANSMDVAANSTDFWVSEMGKAETGTDSWLQALTDANAPMSDFERLLLEAEKALAEENAELEEGAQAWAKYFTAALQAEEGMVSLFGVMESVLGESELLGDELITLADLTDNYSQANIEAAKLTADISRATEEYVNSIDAESFSLDELRWRMGAMFAARIADVNAMIAQEEAARALAETISGAMTNAFETANSAVGDLAGAYDDFDAAQGEWVTRYIDNTEKVAKANEELAGDLTDDQKDAYEDILDTVEEGSADWLAAWDALQGDLTDSQRQALVAQRAELEGAQGNAVSVYTGDADAAEAAEERIIAATLAIRQAYRQMVFDIVAASDGVFDEFDAQLGVSLGIFTQTEADLRLNEQEVQDAVTAFFGTIEEPKVEVVAALNVAFEEGIVSGTDLDDFLTGIRTAVEEQGIEGETVQAVINASLSLGTIDGQIDPSSFPDVFESIDITAVTGDRVEATVVAELAATLDPAGIETFVATTQTIIDSTTSELSQSRIINQVVDVLLSGDVDPTEIDQTITEVLATAEERGITFDQALTFLVRGEADTIDANNALGETLTLVGELNSTDVNISASEELGGIETPFTNLKNLLEGGVDAAPITAGLSGIATEIETTIPPALAAVETVTTSTFTNIATSASENTTALSTDFTTTLSGLNTTTEALLTTLSDIFGASFQGIDTIIIESMNNTNSSVSAGIGTMTSTVQSGLTTITSLATNTSLQFTTIGLGISTGLASGILSGEGEIVAAVTAVVDAAMAAAADAAGTASPSKKTHVIGQDVDRGFAQGIDSMRSLVNKSATRLAEGALNEISVAANSGLGNFAGDFSDNGRAALPPSRNVPEDVLKLISGQDNQRLPRFMEPTSQPINNSSQSSSVIDNSKTVNVAATYPEVEKPDSLSNTVEWAMDRVT